jgi:hypothetical protein
MNTDLYFAILGIFYLFIISKKKNHRKMALFLSKPLNIILILLLVIISYNLNNNLGVILFIMLFFSRQIITL